MEAPKCKICEKRHYGLCHGIVAPVGDEPATVDAARGVVRKHHERPAKVRSRVLSEMKPLLEERLEALEQIVDELLAGKRKRSEYMKVYMRDRRSKG